jgi:hypothetical protein
LRGLSRTVKRRRCTTPRQNGSGIRDMTSCVSCVQTSSAACVEDPSVLLQRDPLLTLWSDLRSAGRSSRVALPRKLTERRKRSSAGTVGIRNRSLRAFEPAALAKAVQDEVFPYELNYFRHASRLNGALARLDAAWLGVAEADAASGADVLRAGESAAMLATARWMYRSALARQESLGMHRRDDFPDQDVRQRHYVTTGGLDDVWTSVRPHAEAAYAEAAE